MKVFQLGNPAPDQSDDPVFKGDVNYRTLVSVAEAQLLRSIDVLFGLGGRTKWHHHECDQLLIITGGHGCVATQDQDQGVAVRAGDVVFIPAGEVHWHGATDTSIMTHVSVLTPGAEVIDE